MGRDHRWGQNLLRPPTITTLEDSHEGETDFGVEVNMAKFVHGETHPQSPKKVEAVLGKDSAMGMEEQNEMEV